jgi:hypothetical protein
VSLYILLLHGASFSLQWRLFAYSLLWYSPWNGHSHKCDSSRNHSTCLGLLNSFRNGSNTPSVNGGEVHAPYLRRWPLCCRSVLFELEAVHPDGCMCDEVGNKGLSWCITCCFSRGLHKCGLACLAVYSIWAPVEDIRSIVWTRPCVGRHGR